MAIHINRLNGGNIVIEAGGSSEPTAPNGKVMYKTSADGEWLESNADISEGVFNGFNEKNSAVTVITPSKDAIGNDVTEIGLGVFYNCTNLTSVTIGNGVQVIKSAAFDGCRSLRSVTIPDSVTSFWSYVFDSCICLTSVTIPNSVTSIGSDAFRGCGGLTSLTFQGKTIAQVQEMSYYPWGIENTSIINVA